MYVLQRFAVGDQEAFEIFFRHHQREIYTPEKTYRNGRGAMNERQDEQLRSLLWRALPSMREHELRQDLWPRMLRRLDDRPSRWTWLDYALVGVVLAGFIAYPEVIPWVLFHC
jgi:hypothetical protein